MGSRRSSSLFLFLPLPFLFTCGCNSRLQDCRHSTSQVLKSSSFISCTRSLSIIGVVESDGRKRQERPIVDALLFASRVGAWMPDTDQRSILILEGSYEPLHLLGPPHPYPSVVLAGPVSSWPPCLLSCWPPRQLRARQRHYGKAENAINPPIILLSCMPRSSIDHPTPPTRTLSGPPVEAYLDH